MLIQLCNDTFFWGSKCEMAPPHTFTTTATSQNLASLITPELHCSRMVPRLLTRVCGGGRGRRKERYHFKWWGLSGVICREFTLLTVTIILLCCWLTPGLFVIYFMGTVKDLPGTENEELQNALFLLLSSFSPFRIVSLWNGHTYIAEWISGLHK